jgi:hypothetical protein
VPLVPLAALGLHLDSDGFLVSDVLKALKSGAEASPFLDEAHGVVYKLFPLYEKGGLGKTMTISQAVELQSFDTTIHDATMMITVEKLCTLHDAGAHPTEIIGLSESGDYLITKQPRAFPYSELTADREAALIAMHAVPCKARFNTAKWIFWLNEQPWAMSDLHQGNIMRDADGAPTIIDALITPLSPFIISRSEALRQSVEWARALRKGLPYLQPRSFEDVDDASL